MTDPQGVWNWVTAHLQALFYVVKVHGREAVAWLGPPVQAVIAWVDGGLQAAIAWAGPATRRTINTAQPYGAMVLAFLAAHWLVAATVAAGTVLAIVLWVAVRRRRRVNATLVDISLDRDPKTEWLRLNIVMRNFQSHALVIRSLSVERPLDARICEHWKAWQPSAEGVKFVAAELALTNEAEIERTIMPHGASAKYHRARGVQIGTDSDDDQLMRSFYLRTPEAENAQAVKLRAVLHCELKTPKGRKQDLSFQRMLEPAVGTAAALAR